jgi:nucleoside-diphosphate-sugar epimerase
MAGAAEVVAADLTDLDQTVRAVAGSSVVHLLAGLKYDHKVWAEQWPRVMNNTIEACKRADAKLIFFDNVYMYGKVAGEMTEDLPFNPCSRKGEVRAQVAMTLIKAWNSGGLTAMIARAADFYGPGAKTGMANVLVFEPMSKKQTPMCLVNDSLPHSYTYTPDAAEALMTLAASDAAWNQTWHLPTVPNPPTAKELIEQAARAMGAPAKYRVLSKPMVRIVGWFKPVVGELHEMLYQNDSPYLFDSSKYTRAFGVQGTAYPEGIRLTAESYTKPG